MRLPNHLPFVPLRLNIVILTVKMDIIATWQKNTHLFLFVVKYVEIPTYKN